MDLTGTARKIWRTLPALLLLWSLPCRAQVGEALEQWVEETDDTWAAGEMSDQWLQLTNHPVNLNDTAAYGQLFFLSPFQKQALRNYIALYGQLLSLGELRFVPGLDSATAAMLAPVATVAPYTPAQRWRLADGHHRLVSAVGGSVEEAAGYRDSSYAGDRLHALLCYSYDLYGKVNVRVVSDKDPGERWGKGNFLSYHVMVDDVGPVERLIAGRYNLQFGQGLTLWTGLRPFNLTGAVPLRFGSGIRQAATFYEEDYQEGVAARVRMGGGVRLSAFGSRVEDETLAGGHLEWRHGNLIVGATAAAIWFDSALTVRDYTYNQLRFRGDRQLNAGLDAVWQWRRLTLYGEAAIGENGAPAAIGGLTVQADSRNRFGVTARHYNPLYHNLHAQGYAIGSTQGESGVTFDAESRLPWGLTGTVSLDLHRFPSLRYADYSPSSGAWLRVQLGRQWGSWLTSTVRYTYRQKERNIPNLDTTLYLGEQTWRQQWQGELKGTVGDWTLTARGIHTLFDSESGAAQRGTLVSLAARYSHRRLSASAAAAWFDVDGYYARIYFSESNLQYAWSMPALNGRGLRCHAVVRWKVSDGLTLAGKYTLTYMPGVESIGSGDSQTNGPHRQTWMLHARVQF